MTNYVSLINILIHHKKLLAFFFIAVLLVTGCKASKTAEELQAMPDNKSKVAESNSDSSTAVAANVDGVEQGSDETSKASTPSESTDAAAAVNTSLRASFEACSKTSGGVAEVMQACIAEEYEYQDSRLNAAYQQQKKLLPKQQMEQLKIDQRKWIAERDNKCKWDEKTEGQAQRLQANYCAMEETVKRLVVLEKMTISPITSQLDQNGLELKAGDISIKVVTSNCRNESTSVGLCNNALLSVKMSGNSSIQTMNLPTLYLNKDKAIYRGPLNTNYEMRGHSFVIADINADEQEDLLLWTGKLGANGGASFNIYLRDSTKKQWVFNKAFSELTIGKNGVISVANDKLKVSSKSGCCVHINETYTVTGSFPKLEERVTEDATGGISPPKKTVEKMINGKMQAVN